MITESTDIIAKNRRVSLTASQRASAEGAELLSLCQSVTSDGSLAESEIQSLREWLKSNSDSDLPAIAFLIGIVEKIVADGVVTSDESRELFLAMEKVLPQDVREFSRTARKTKEREEKIQKKLEANELKQKLREENERNRPVEHFDFMIAGAKYEGRPALIAQYVRTPDPVYFARDPTNRYSRNAVKVLASTGHEIGFVPEDDAFVLAPLLDSGHCYEAQVKKILSGRSHDIPVIVVDIYRADASLPNVVRLSDPLPVPGAALSGPFSRSMFPILAGIAVFLLFFMVAVKSCSV